MLPHLGGGKSRPSRPARVELLQSARSASLAGKRAQRADVATVSTRWGREYKSPAPFVQGNKRRQDATSRWERTRARLGASRALPPTAREQFVSPPPTSRIAAHSARSSGPN